MEPKLTTLPPQLLQEQLTSLLKVFSAATSADDLLANWMKAQLPFDAIVIERISPNCKSIKMFFKVALVAPGC